MKLPAEAPRGALPDAGRGVLPGQLLVQGSGGPGDRLAEGLADRGGGPGVGGEDDAIRLDPRLGGADLCRAAGQEFGDAGALVDLHAPGQGHPAHASGQQRRLYGGIAALEDAGQENGRATSAASRRWNGVTPKAFAGLEGGVPGVHVAGRGGRPEPALLPEVGIDAMFGAELAKFGDGALGALAQEARLLGVAEAPQGADLRQPGHDETAVAS